MDNKEVVIQCDGCNKIVKHDCKICPQCGTQLLCPGCKERIEKRWKICPYCLTNLSGSITPPLLKKKKTSNNDKIFFSGDNFGIQISIPEGTIISNKYTIKKEIEKGGYGIVHVAYDSDLKKDLAIKIVVTGDQKNKEKADLLIHEFNLRDKINDLTYIIKSYDPRTCEYNGLTLILMPMELARGGNLRTWLTNKNKTKDRIVEGLKYFKHACKGIRAIHKEALSHLDIKPSNILISAGKAKITDFGLGRFINKNFGDNPSYLLRQGLGTPVYMSPEQFRPSRQKDIGQPSDIYHLGLILFEILDGSVPFDGNSFDELKEKHLYNEPPVLKNDLKIWNQVITRCLAKKPQNRYESIDHLLKDIERIEMGTPLSIDVSCPNCGHINIDKKKIFCEKCPSDLSNLFHECQHCGKLIRKDIAICPICGFRVLEKLIFDERKRKIKFLQEEDIDEAIEILELMIGPGGFATNEDFDLIRNLRKKQDKVIPLRNKANKEYSNGNIEKSINYWQKILEILPKDIKATLKTEDLKERYGYYQLYKKTGAERMVEGFFEEALKSFNKCETIIPNRAATKDLISSCKTTEKAFNNALKNADRTYRKLLLEESLKYLNKALSYASNSLGLKKRKNELQLKIKKIKTMLETAQESLISADFNTIEQILSQIKEVQLDNIEVKNFIKNFQEIKTKYLNEFQHSIEVKNTLILSKAKNHASLALNICHNSSACKQIITQINNDIEKVTSLLKSAKKLLSYAAFNEIQEVFNQIEELQLDNTEYESFKKKYKEIKTEYSNKLEQSIKAKRNLDLSKAKEYASLTLNICKNSRECRQLLKIIDSEQKKVISLLDSAESFINQAQFEKALEEISHIHKIWINNKRTNLLSETLEKTRADYENHINNIHISVNQGDISKALEYINFAKNICPDSVEIDDLQSTVNDRKRMVRDLLEEAKKSIPYAHFNIALKKIESAKRMWSDYYKNEQQNKNILKSKKDYEQILQQTKDNMVWGWLIGYKEAKNSCENACRICTRSAEAKELLNNIEEKITIRFYSILAIIIAIVFLFFFILN